MQIALSAASCAAADLPALLSCATDAGFCAVQLFRHRTHASLAQPDWSIRRLREKLADAGIALPACEIRPLTGRKADSDEHNLAYNLRQLEWDTHLCRALGVGTIGLRAGADTDEARQDLIEGLGQLAEKILDVRFAIGPQAGTCLASAAQIDALLPDLPDTVGILLDTAQLHAAGDDVASCAAAWSDRLALAYLCDTHGGQTVALGDGDVDIDGVLAAVRDTGCTIAVETTEDSLAPALQRLRG